MKTIKVTKAILLILCVSLFSNCSNTSKHSNEDINFQLRKIAHSIFNDKFEYSVDSIKKGLITFNDTIVKRFTTEDLKQKSFDFQTFRDSLNIILLQKNIEYISKTFDSLDFVQTHKTYSISSKRRIISFLPQKKFREEEEGYLNHNFIYTGKYEIEKSSLYSSFQIKLIYDNKEPESALHEKEQNIKELKVLKPTKYDIQQVYRSRNAADIYDPFLKNMKLDESSPLLLVSYYHFDNQESNSDDIAFLYFKIDKTYAKHRVPLTINNENSNASEQQLEYEDLNAE